MLSDLQKKIAIYTMLNPNSQRYIINCYAELPIDTNIKRLKTSILNAVKLHPILTSQVGLQKGDFKLYRTKEFLEKDIEFTEDEKYHENDIKNKEFFCEPFLLGNDKFLFRIGISKTKTNNTPTLLLMISVHHLIFDAFSGINLLGNIYDLYVKEDNYIKLKTVLDEEYKNYYSLGSKSEFKKAEEYYKNFDNFISKNVNYKKINGVKYSKFNAYNYKDLSIRSQSALAIYSMALSLQEENSMDEIVVGVPVPNRNSKNRNIISCLVNVLPIFVNLKIKNSDAILKDIEHQLFTNLRFQRFDYLAKYSKYFIEGGFDCIFTYYPSNFIVKNDEISIECKEIFFLEPQAKFHVVMYSNLDVIVSCEIGEKVINNFKNKMLKEII
ncbi:condensation domain-containing protein [Clostridium paraputrificum]|uniref:condensation domain-containing protein n=1 Tax=Clostridium paraputrificum TaxID=29363 RepID=UPI003D34A423